MIIYYSGALISRLSAPSVVAEFLKDVCPAFVDDQRRIREASFTDEDDERPEVLVVAVTRTGPDGCPVASIRV